MTRNESRESQERDRQLNNNDDDTVLHASQHFINKQRHTHTHSEMESTSRADKTQTAK